MNNRQLIRLELILILLAFLVGFWAAARFDLLERLVEFSRQHEALEIDELVIAMIAAMVGLIVFSWRRLRELNQIRVELQRKNERLRKNLDELQTLREMLPICSYCKNIRDDAGYWHRVESYFTRHARTTFTHGICPDCRARHFPDLLGRADDKD